MSLHSTNDLGNLSSQNYHKSHLNLKSVNSHNLGLESVLKMSKSSKNMNGQPNFQNENQGLLRTSLIDPVRRPITADPRKTI